MEDRDIAIVGISIYCPAGDSVGEFWRGISRGGDFITDVPDDVIDSFHFNGKPNGIDKFYCKRGGFNKEVKLDPIRYGVMPVVAEGTEPDQLLSLVGAEQALIDAGVFEKKIPLQDCSIIIGKGNFSGIVQLRSSEIVRTARQFGLLLKSALPGIAKEDIERVQKAYQSRQGRYQPDMAIGTMPNLVASIVANHFDMHGPAYTVDAACASGIVAINHSIALLRDGQCDVAVAGGMHSAQSAMFWGVFEMLGAMSRRQVIAPFSKNADGLLVGQGGGFLVLKTLRRALEDGDRVYAVIKDTAVGSDGGFSHVTVTSVAGQMRVLEQAWKKSQMDPERVGYIEAHGTGTPVGDRTEIATLTNFFGDKTHPRAYVGSIKSNIGHTMPAAGMIGVIKTALSLYWRKIPPTLHCEQPLPAMFESRFMPPQELMNWDAEQLPLIAGVNAFGFGGINAHAILTAYEPEKGGWIRPSFSGAAQAAPEADSRNMLTLPRGVPPVLTELPELNEVLGKLLSGASAAPLANGAGPIAEAANQNILEAINVQQEMARLFRQHKGQAPVSQAQSIEAPTLPEKAKPRVGESFTELLKLSLDGHMYLLDHSIVRQPDDWPFRDDLNPVVPFTMTLEIFAEIGMKHAPGKKLIKFTNISAYKWIQLEKPAEVAVKGKWIQQNVLAVEFEGYAKGEMTFGDVFLQPKPDISDIGQSIKDPPPAKLLYDGFSFHGPQYRSMTKQTAICSRGMKCVVEKKGGKGSLLDIMGQQLGLFLHLTQTQNTISFPVRLKELAFYADIFDQQGVFEHTMAITRLTENVVVGDMSLKRGGNVWCMASGFVCQRFENYIPTWRMIISPQTSLLADELAPGVFFYTFDPPDTVLFLLYKRYMSAPDREGYDNSNSFTPQKKERLISRIALKDAVRSYVAEDGGLMMYPIEFHCAHDEKGRPYLIGHGDAAEKVDKLCVSIAHKGNAAAAMASSGPVGIDLETIEEKSEGFMKACYTKKELTLLKGMPNPESATRFWVAKEACAKKTGEGLKGDPKRFEVHSVQGNILFVGGERVKTVKLASGHIVGWTE